TEPEIQQIAIFGEAQPHLLAVIYAPDDTQDQQLAAALQRANSRMPDYAQIKHWCRSPEPFSLNNQMLTDNRKLRRQQIQQKFQAELKPDESQLFFASFTDPLICRMRENT